MERRAAADRRLVARHQRRRRAPHDRSQHRLSRGDVALLHTDGVTESRNAAGECYDMQRLTDELKKLHDKPAAAIVTTIAAAAWQWAGTPKDDVSLMAVKRS